MADLPRRSTLEHRAGDLERVATLSGGTLRLTEVAFVAQSDLRTADPAALGLPTAPNTWCELHDADALWLGPDEWLLVGDGAPDVAAHAASAVDVSANRAVLELSGPGALALLAKGCSLDLHPSAWRAGDCAQSMLAKAPVILQQRDEVTRIFVRPSFAEYLLEWVLAACP